MKFNILLGWYLLAMLTAVLLLTSCKEDSPAPEQPSGRVAFEFRHQVDGSPLVMNDMKYTNAAGNDYMITDVMYFISDITLYKSGGSTVIIDDWKDIFYIDEKIPSTRSIMVFDPVPVGSYDSVSFIFGIPEAKNQSFMYVNPPEVIMAWPEVLGGGYHYMMINGKWKNPAGSILPFNFHLGIGQLYHGSGFEIDSIYAFVQNYFRVSLPASSFNIQDQDTLNFSFTMNIGSWFATPHVYDHDFWGGAIMQNQSAMQMAKENGHDIFSVIISTK